jgi:tRNA G18 (ribose-2'-O)-methylase SpoU
MNARGNQETAGTAERCPLRVVLDNVRSAFNVGSIFRAADACAVEHLYLCGMTAHPPHSRLARTALGAEAVVPWSHHRKTAEALDALERLAVPIVAVEALEGAVSYVDFAWPERVALVFGHEVRGIAPDLLARCAGVVRIPMFGEKNTLNVATAAGIVMYEILRRWGALADPPRGVQQGFWPP